MTDTELTKTLNRRAMDLIEQKSNPGFVYVNYGKAIEPVSFGENRSDGGHKSHYGWQARFVFIQMLVNQLVDMNLFS